MTVTIGLAFLAGLASFYPPVFFLLFRRISVILVADR